MSSADARYQELHATATRLVDQIARQLKAHAEAQAATPTHWTHVGDLGGVVDSLQEVADILSADVSDDPETAAAVEALAVATHAPIDDPEFHLARQQALETITAREKL